MKLRYENENEFIYRVGRPYSNLGFNPAKQLVRLFLSECVFRSKPNFLALIQCEFINYLTICYLNILRAFYLNKYTY